MNIAGVSFITVALSESKSFDQDHNVAFVKEQLLWSEKAAETCQAVQILQNSRKFDLWAKIDSYDFLKGFMN